MDTLGLILVLAVPVLLVGLLVYLLVIGWGKRRGNRFRIMSRGVAAQAAVTRIEPRPDGQVMVDFTLVPRTGGSPVNGRQYTTPAAVQSLQLQVGAALPVLFLNACPRWAFSDALVKAECQAAAPMEADAVAVAHFYVSYSDPVARAAAGRSNNLRWFGAGDLALSRRSICFRNRNAFQRRLRAHVVPFDAVVDVEQLGPVIRLRLLDDEGLPTKRLQFWAIDTTQAVQIAQRLSAVRTASFAPALAEGAAFLATLRTVTPTTPVTPVLVGLNVMMFAVATLRGGGFIVPDGAAMIAMGTDYTPLTLGGQWWRLLTSVFLHFGLLHLLFNMWALWLNGAVAERLYGASRYLFIYLVAGVGGSLASLLWHPIVNGAGASGAIFGILGALIAFLLRRRQDLPASVVKAQLTGTMVFVVYNLAYGTRGGVDNAAHLGGLLGGFLTGLLLARPLSTARHARRWTAQWVLAGTVVSGAVVLVAALLMTGRLAPRHGQSVRGGPPPATASVVATRSLAGVSLGMSAAELLAAKGAPRTKESTEVWLYNSIDALHRGTVSVQFGKPGTAHEGTVDVIEYIGDRRSAPPEMPFLKFQTVTELETTYGKPASRVAMDGGTTYLWFRNGIVAGVRGNRVELYGIFDASMVGDL